MAVFEVLPRLVTCRRSISIAIFWALEQARSCQWLQMARLGKAPGAFYLMYDYHDATLWESRGCTSDSHGMDLTFRTSPRARFGVIERRDVIMSPLWGIWHLSTLSARFWLHVRPLSLVRIRPLARIVGTGIGKRSPTFWQSPWRGTVTR